MWSSSFMPRSLISSSTVDAWIFTITHPPLPLLMPGYQLHFKPQKFPVEWLTGHGMRQMLCINLGKPTLQHGTTYIWPRRCQTHYSMCPLLKKSSILVTHNSLLPKSETKPTKLHDAQILNLCSRGHPSWWVPYAFPLEEGFIGFWDSPHQIYGPRVQGLLTDPALNY